MKDPERLVMVGTEPERAFLARAMDAPLVPPAELHLRLRRSLEERLFRPASRPGVAAVVLALGAMLLAGSALGYGLVRLRAVATVARPIAAPPSSRPLVVPTTAVPTVPAPSPIETSDLPATANAQGAAGRQRALAVRARAPLSSPLGAPALAGPWDFGSSAPGDEPLDPGDQGPRPGSPRLAIVRERRAEVSLVLAGNKVAGKIGDVLVALTVERRQIFGKLGHLTVWVSLRGSRAEGTVGDRPIRFELIDTPDGHLLRQGRFLTTSFSSETARVFLGAGSLTWSPGCDTPLPRAGDDAYRGRCASGQEARVVLPASWRSLDVLPRLILLSFFLPERAHEGHPQATAGPRPGPSR